MTTASGGEGLAPDRGVGAGGLHRRPTRPLARRLRAGIRRIARTGVAAIVLALLLLLGLRAYQSGQGPPLRPWHTVMPAELDADAIAGGDWNAYVAAEARMFEQLHRRLEAKMEPADRTLLNRYHGPSRASPATFGRDWNRSFVLEPAGAPRGVAVLLHGMTDSPYSMRSLAEWYQRQGFIALAPRMPGHGTVPAGLTRQGRREWQAAVAMAAAEASRRAGKRLPVHLVGYSNGGALSVLHVMQRVARGLPAEVDRIVLLSPMIEVSGFARYAGLAGAPAMFGRYAKSAWLDLLPEYNPFKYNSFPVRAARESYLVTADLRAAIDSVAAQQRMHLVPPILAFQSVVDDTVSARGVMTGLFDKLPANGSELVFFDVNRKRVVAPVLSAEQTDWSRDVLEGPPRRYALTLVGAVSDEDAAVVARSRPAGGGPLREYPTGLAYPADVYSLSHVALPFPASDALYGNRPPPGGRGVHLGALALRGERRTLVLSQDSLNRLSYNPFHDYMTARIAGAIEAPAVP